MAGTSSDRQPLAAAMPATVEGPPMFALLAMSRSLRENPHSLPTTSISTKCAASAMALNANSTGAVRMTSAMLADAPTAAKNTCMRMAANPSPAGASAPNLCGSAVASATVMPVMRVMLCVGGRVGWCVASAGGLRRSVGRAGRSVLLMMAACVFVCVTQQAASSKAQATSISTAPPIHLRRHGPGSSQLRAYVADRSRQSHRRHPLRYLQCMCSARACVVDLSFF